MTLTIHKLSTRCHSPKSFAWADALVDDVAHGPLASELAAQLGPSLDRLPAIVRIQALRVQVAIPAKQFSPPSLADRWARAFTLALHSALAHPESSGVVAIRRYQSHAQYVAALIRHLLTEGSSPTWEFPELVELRDRSAPQAALDFLLRQPAEIADSILHLSRANWLEPFLGILDDLPLERLMQALAGTEVSERGLDLSALIELGQSMSAPGALQPQWPMASRRQTVRLWSRLVRRFPLRAMWHGMRLLVHLLENPTTFTSPDHTLSGTMPFPGWCDVLRAQIAALLNDDRRVSRTTITSLRGSDTAQPRGPLAALNTVLSDLRPLLPSAARSGRPGRWIQSQNCGILLFLSTAQHMGFFRVAGKAEFETFGGPRAVSFLLAALGMTLAGQPSWDMDDPMDPAVLLFAGVLAEFDRAGMKHFFSQVNPHVVSDRAGGGTWHDALQLLAADLASQFAQRVRGFRQASRAAVVKQFIRIPGRILVEDDRLLVILSATPWAVALRISAMDESLQGIEWLPGRHVDFVLEGL